ncbi:unnamed protein product, partial [Adineta steineri]
LNEHYGDKLKCSCSLIALAYDQFVKIQPRFHEICSSPFASDQWRRNLTAGLVPNLTEYEQRDYRRFLSAHLQFLTRLCQLSMDLVNDAVNQLNSSLLVTTQLLSETGNDSFLQGITVADLNGDTYLDIAVANSYQNNVRVFFGDGKQTFIAQMTLYSGRSSYPNAIAVADFNSDGYKDIAVLNYYGRNVGIFLGYGNGSFQAQQMSFTGSFYHPTDFKVGDFNSDGRLDVAVSYNTNGWISVLFGFDNGTLGSTAKLVLGNYSSLTEVGVGDFNGDGYLDISVGTGGSSIAILVGNGNGDFEQQVIVTLEDDGYYISSIAGDFNGDGYQDIVAMDQKYGFLYLLLNTGQCYPNKTLETSTFIHQ